MEKRHQIGLSSYDRLFPNQDTLPKGGFGNLIALPLQREPRSLGNSAFIDRDGQLCADQWATLAQIKKTTEPQILSILSATPYHNDVGDIARIDVEDDAFNKPWKNPKRAPAKILGPFPEKAKITLVNMVYLEKSALPSAMLNQVLRIAAFQNPEFYKAQAMRLSTYDKPRIISCGQDFANHVAVPRGCLREVVDLLKEHSITPEIIDERFCGTPIQLRFQGELRELQTTAVQELLRHDIGVLCATTAFGKTVVAASLIAQRKTNTLILVHRKQLMDQWKNQLAMFLNVPVKSIGEIGGGKTKATGTIDIAMMQALHRHGEVKPLLADYGHIIVDECHHVSAFSFESVLKAAKAKYVLGLTATPVRKDGHHPIITMQCGPIRYIVSPKQQHDLTNFQHIVVARYTTFRVPDLAQRCMIQQIYAALTEDRARNDLIFNDLVQALQNGRSPLVLTERTEHLLQLEKRLREFAKNIFVLRNGMGKKQRDAVMKALADLPDSAERIILATGPYIGEGFDDSRLDTLLLAMPISWKGTLQQYVGRLHRTHHGKTLVQVYDYVDQEVPMLQRMFQRRLSGYRAIGYSLQSDHPQFPSISLAQSTHPINMHT